MFQKKRDEKQQSTKRYLDNKRLNYMITSPTKGTSDSYKEKGDPDLLVNHSHW